MLSRQEIQKERRTRWVEWALVAAACAVIVICVTLPTIGGLG
jgi:hypothetical protein